MPYTLRFESNAFQADSAMAKVVNALNSLKRVGRRIVGATNEEFAGNRLEELYGVNRRTFQRAMDWAEGDFDQQMSSAQWDWKGPDGTTRRKNGETVTEPRDIVDMGTLLKSKKRNDINASMTEFEWTAEHAEGVHDGYRLKNGGVNPARPWTEPTIADLDEVIQSILNKGGK